MSTEPNKTDASQSNATNGNALIEALSTVQGKLNLYYSPVVMVLTFAGFFTMLLVLLRLRTKVKGKDYVLFAITVADTITVVVRVLIDKFLAKGISHYLSFSLAHLHNSVACRLYGYTWVLCTSASNNLLCLMAGDRLLALYAPLWHRVHLSNRVYAYLLMATLLLMSTSAAFALFTFDAFVYAGRPSCYYNRQLAQNAATYSYLQAYTNLVINGPAAGIFLLIANVAVVLKIRRLRRNHQSEDISASIRLIAVACFYLISTLPRSFCYFATIFIDYAWPSDWPKQQTRLQLFSIGNVLDWLFYTHCSTNWLLYLIITPQLRSAIFQLKPKEHSPGSNQTCNTSV